MNRRRWLVTAGNAACLLAIVAFGVALTVAVWTR